MLNIYHMLKAVLAELSFLLEYYFHIYPAWVSIVIMSITTGFLVTVPFLLLKNFSVKIQRLWQVVSASYLMVSGFFMNTIVKNLPTCISRIQRVMENFAYVTSFDGNRQTFLFGLGIADNEANRESIQRIAYFLNDKQWQSVIDYKDGSAWYFEKIKDAIDGVVKIGRTHLSVGILYQSTAAFIPVLILFALAIGLLFYKKKIGIIVLFSALFSLIGNLGGAIYIMFGWLSYFIFYRLFWEKPIAKREGTLWENQGKRKTA